MCPKVSSHPALLEEPERAALVPGQEPALKPQEQERVQLQQERAQVQEVLQPERAALVQERVQTLPPVSSLLEIAPESQASDSPLLPQEQGRRPGSQALPLRLKSPDWLAAPQVVNKTQPGKNQGP
jgi:hypothetical protein